MDLARMPKDRYARGAWRNGVGLCGDATWQGIFRPMVRRRCIRPRVADGVRGGFVLRHRTPESCLKIPLPSGILGVKHAHALCTSNCRASDLFRKALYINMLRSQLPADHPRIPRTSRNNRSVTTIQKDLYPRITKQSHFEILASAASHQLRWAAVIVYQVDAGRRSDHGPLPHLCAKGRGSAGRGVHLALSFLTEDDLLEATESDVESKSPL